MHSQRGLAKQARKQIQPATDSRAGLGTLAGAVGQLSDEYQHAFVISLAKGA